MAVSDYTALIEAHAAANGVPAAWVKAVMEQESRGDPMAYRAEPRIQDASYGLMQLLSSTARGLGYSGPVDGLYDPDTNIGLGAQLLAQLKSRYGDDLAAVYSAYNSGSGTAYLSNPTIAARVEKVLVYASEFFEEHPAAVTAGSGLLVGVILLMVFLRRKT